MRLAVTVLALAAGASAAAADPALEAAAGAAVPHDALAASIGVQTPTFISRIAALRVGLSWIGGSHYRSSNRAQLLGTIQVAIPLGRFEIAAGPAVLQHADGYDSGRMNIATALDFAATAHWHVRAEHFSNAESQFPNIGRNLLLAVYRF